MKSIIVSVAIGLGLALAACESVAENPGDVVASTDRNVIESDGFRLVMNWCEVVDRAAQCELTATSLTQDYKAGFAYPILQDQTGAEFRMVPVDGSLGQYTMIAGEPYTILYKNRDILPTTVERVRGVVGTWSINDLRNLRVGAFPVTFADIPARPAPAPSPATDTAPVTADPAPVPDSAGTLSNAYWHGIIVPTVDMDDNDIIRLWRNGAYIHFREDGIAGYNWAVPAGYIYDGANQWSETDSQFTLSMSGAVYVFDKTGGDAPLVTHIQPGGAFEMTLTPKAAGEE